MSNGFPGVSQIHLARKEFLRIVDEAVRAGEIQDRESYVEWLRPTAEARMALGHDAASSWLHAARTCDLRNAEPRNVLAVVQPPKHVCSADMKDATDEARVLRTALDRRLRGMEEL